MTRTLVTLAAAAAAAHAQAGVSHTQLRYNGCEVHVLVVPAGSDVYPQASRPGKTLEAFVARHNAVAGINAGYFNHSDGWPVSHVLYHGVPQTHPEDNRALKTNPALVPILGKILNHRAEWRAAEAQPWRIAFHDDPVPERPRLLNALQAGPRLLPAMDLVGEGFIFRDARGRVVRDGIASMRRATRSALGLRSNGDMVLVGVGAPGLTLSNLALLMAKEGAVTALNLDGGSSTGLVWREHGRVRAFHGDHGSAPINSVLLVGP